MTKEKWELEQYVMKDKGYSARMKQQGGLACEVALVVGCKVIIMTNIDTDMQMSNRAHGEVVQIWSDPHEEGENNGSVEEMMYPPTCILIKRDQFQEAPMAGLEASTIPLFPVVKMIEYRTGNGKKQKVKHCQITLDGAYVFMDY